MKEIWTKRTQQIEEIKMKWTEKEKRETTVRFYLIIEDPILPISISRSPCISISVRRNRLYLQTGVTLFLSFLMWNLLWPGSWRFRIPACLSSSWPRNLILSFCPFVQSPDREANRTSSDSKRQNLGTNCKASTVFKSLIIVWVPTNDTCKFPTWKHLDGLFVIIGGR